MALDPSALSAPSAPSAPSASSSIPHLTQEAEVMDLDSLLRCTDDSDVRGTKRARPDNGDDAVTVSKKLLQKTLTYSEALERFQSFDSLSDSDALNAALCAMHALPPEDGTAQKILDGISSEAAKMKGFLYRGKICLNLARKAPKNATAHLNEALGHYKAVLESTAAKESDRHKARAARDSVLYQLRRDRLDFSDDVREQARKLPAAEKVGGSDTKWRTQGEIVDIETDTCSCRLKVGCKHMCLVYGAEAGPSLKGRTKDQLVALMKLNNMCFSGRTNEDMIKDLLDAKARGGAPPPCPVCGSYMDEECGQFRCRKNRDGKAKRCDFLSSLPRVPLRGL